MAHCCVGPSWIDHSLSEVKIRVGIVAECKLRDWLLANNEILV